MPDYSYIHIGRGRIYSDLNKGSDSTIESSYLNPKLNKVEAGAIDSAALTELKQRLSAIEQDSGNNKNAIEAVAADVAILNASAETAGSVDNKIATQIAEKIDSTKIAELQALVESLGEYPDQTVLVNQVTANKNDIADLRIAIGGLSGGVTAEQLAAVDEKATTANTTANAVKAITDALAVNEVAGTTLKEKIDAEIEANFEAIDVNDLNLTWN